MATRQSARKPSTREPAPIAMLIADHRKVENLFDRYRRCDDDDEKAEICSTVCALLTVHTMLEEEVFYPAALDLLPEPDSVNEALVEHGVAKGLVAQLEADDLDPEKRDALFEVLSEYVRHHVEEEEGKLFKQLRKTDIDFDELAEQMSERKEELEAEHGLGDDEGEDDDEDGDDEEPEV